MDAAIFPGQGAQSIGMGRDVAERYAAARETFERADALLGFPLSTYCFEGPPERLNATDIQQPAIFTTSVAIYRAALQAGRLREQQFARMGGLSLGEYTALHLAGALSFDDALRLVYRRGQLMQQASEAAPGGMVCLIGMDESGVLSLCERVRQHGRIGPANLNCPGQIVVSGDRAACQAAIRLAEQAGGRAVPLDVAGAFHSELMQPAAEVLREALREADFRTPRVPVVANVDATYHGEPDAIRESLYRQVFNPVRWQACIEQLAADGTQRFFEIGPNRVLTGLNRKINRRLQTINLSRADDLTSQS